MPSSQVLARSCGLFVGNSSSIRSLQAAFRDPSSPFHIPPGTQGPTSPEDHPHVRSDTAHITSTSSAPGINLSSAAEDARKQLIAEGYDPASFWEQHIVWGDHDAFQHVNNVRYARFFESGRIHWLTSLGNEMGGQDAADAFLRARGVSFILKSIEIIFKRPVAFPDTLLIAHKPLPYPSTHPGARTHLPMHAVAYSYAQRAVVTESPSVAVWYNYAGNPPGKCDPGDDKWGVVWGRVKQAADT